MMHTTELALMTQKSILKPGDLVLVEGRSRVSSNIQFITNSNWSHAAVFIGKTDFFNHCLIEVKTVDGFTYTDIDTYKHHNLRICRPIFLDKKKDFNRSSNQENRI